MYYIDVRIFEKNFQQRVNRNFAIPKAVFHRILEKVYNFIHLSMWITATPKSLRFQR